MVGNTVGCGGRELGITVGCGWEEPGVSGELFPIYVKMFQLESFSFSVKMLQLELWPPWSKIGASGVGFLDD